jgi:hypothetical protein
VSFLEEIKGWEKFEDGYEWARQNNIHSEAQAWERFWHPSWLHRLVQKRGVSLDESKLRLFACECADQVLPILEEKYPEDGRPRLALEVARCFARGEISKEELIAKGNATRDILTGRDAGLAVHYTVWAVCNAIKTNSTKAEGRDELSGVDAWATARDAANAIAYDAQADAIKASEASSQSPWEEAGRVARTSRADKFRIYFSNPFVL